MLTVHHLGISQSDRIVWLCEELGLDYDLRLYARDSVTRLAPSEYGALHPLGTAPVIYDGDLVLGESAAIVDYIVTKYGDGRLRLSPDHPDFADYLFWFHFANGSLVPATMIDMVAHRLGPDAQAATKSLRARGDRAFAMVEARLGEVAYFAGDDFTAADILMLFPLTTGRLFAPRDISGYPNLLAYLQRIGARPAYRRAMAKADPALPPQLG